MPKTQKRGSAYFEARLRKGFPAIYADLLAGKFSSVRAAAVAAGIVKPQTQLNALKRAWAKANAAQRKAFIEWAKFGATHSAAPARRARKVVDSKGRLLTWANKRIGEIMARKRLSQNDVMKEMAIPPLNTSLWSARGKNRGISGVLVDRLEKWLDDNRGV